MAFHYGRNSVRYSKLPAVTFFLETLRKAESSTKKAAGISRWTIPSRRSTCVQKCHQMYGLSD